MTNLSTDKFKIPKVLNLLGLFGIFFIIGIVTTLFYSPVFTTNAAETNTVSIGAEIENVVSVALNTNELNFEFTPTPEGVFDSKYVDVSVKTNTFGGYELYFSSVDNDTNMESSASTDVISSDFSGAVAGSDMENNKWGYSLDTTSAILDKEYSIIPALNNRLTLANTSSSTPGAVESKRVYIGVKVDSTLFSGTYEKVLEFTGVAHDYDLCDDCTVLDLAENEYKDFTYINSAKEILVGKTGYYKVEAWGAQGGSTCSNGSKIGGYGGYTSGYIELQQNDMLYVVVGSHPSNGAGFNGGGSSTMYQYDDGGGGATDLRVFSNNLSSRIMVAAGGGGCGGYGGGTPQSGEAGGLTSYRGRTNNSGGACYYTYEATQTSGGYPCSAGADLSRKGVFGIGGSYETGGGGGWYGGGGGWNMSPAGSGGSSYISGHAGAIGTVSSSDSSPKCAAGSATIECSKSWTNYAFVDGTTVMIDGKGYEWKAGKTTAETAYTQMPNPSGGYYANGVGRSGDGYARITYLGTEI